MPTARTTTTRRTISLLDKTLLLRVYIRSSQKYFVRVNVMGEGKCLMVVEVIEFVRHLLLIL